MRNQVIAVGEVYHVFNQSVAHEQIFHGTRECRRAQLSLWYYQHQNLRLKFSDYLVLSQEKQIKLKLELGKYPKLVDVLAYCLMPNHYHLLVHQNTHMGISEYVSNWQNSYAKYFNKKFERRGSLFLRPFRAVRVVSDEHLLHVSRYIHLNPVTGYIIKPTQDIGNYPWSSWHEYISPTTAIITQPNQILQYVGSDPRQYKSFVMDNADYQRALKNIEYLTKDHV